MNRRRLLYALGAGGLGLTSYQQVTAELSPIANREFELNPPEVDGPGERTDDGSIKIENEPPSVEFSNSESTIEVTGHMLVGSGSCDRAVLKQVTYHARPDALQVVVGTGPQREGFFESIQPGRICTLAMTGDTYRVRVRMADDLPKRVVAVEHGAEETKTTAVQNPTQ